MARLLAVLAVVVPSAAQAQLRAELCFGLSHSVPSQVRIDQQGEPPLLLTGPRDNAPFHLPPYWLARLGYQSKVGELSLELAHHKVFLVEPAPPVQHFAISHGFNLLLAAWARELATGFWARAGVGAVIAHPESEVRGKTLEGGGALDLGLYLAGPAGLLGAQQRLPLALGVYLTLDVGLTAAYAVVPIADGSAQLADVAVHARLGLGYLAAGRR